jgi:endogenous inhibitor of DNA gyrase (YacG/DUF329 family)
MPRPLLVQCRRTSPCVACDRPTAWRDTRVHVHVCSAECQDAYAEVLDLAALDPSKYGPDDPPEDPSAQHTS